MAEFAIASPFCGQSDMIAPRGAMSRAIFRCREADIDRISNKIGITLPRVACQSSQDGTISALWLGPDEWLLLHDEYNDGWVSNLLEELQGELYSLVDVSHRQVALSIEGPRAEEILNSGCALDLSIENFPQGTCMRTMFAKAEIVLWRAGPSGFHLEVWRSFARYVEELLREAERET